MAYRWGHRSDSQKLAAEAVRHHRPPGHPVVHPQLVIEAIERERSQTGRFDSWLADHIVGLAGTMFFFHTLWLVIGGWAIWQSAVQHNKGFDPFPYAFLFFVLGGIMQSLFVPTMLTASNRSSERDRIKDEADHQALTSLYEMNEEQLQILRELAAELLVAKAGPAAKDGA